MDDKMQGQMQDVTKRITDLKKLSLAKEEIYPHLRKFTDAALELRGIAIIAAKNQQIGDDKVWKWILKQLEE